ncbi:hypothetical protein Tco_0910409 [Tanacetum coccineum]|uniref:Uncharacterized protein n=1 Tax=Tanacetum coccineum TaxID=301880 RepID=A0ABQ5CZ43_9ASTR
MGEFGTGYQENDKNKHKTGQNRAQDWKERKKTSPTVPSDFIGPARNPFYGSGQPMLSKAQSQAHIQYLTELFSKYYPPSHTGRKKEVNRIDTDGERDPTNVEFAKWLASKFTNHLTMDSYTKNALWIYWKKGNDEEVLTNEELSGLEEENTGEENEIAEIFKIETDIFHFETPLCKAFKELNYLL